MSSSVLTRCFKPLAAVGMAMAISACSTTKVIQNDRNVHFDESSGVTTVYDKDGMIRSQAYNAEYGAARLKAVEHGVKEQAAANVEQRRHILDAEQGALRNTLAVEEKRTNNLVRLYNAATVSEILQTQIGRAKAAIEKGRPVDEYEADMFAILSFADQNADTKNAIETAFGVSLDSLKDAYGPVEERPGGRFYGLRNNPVYKKYKEEKCKAMATVGIQTATFQLAGYRTSFHLDNQAEPYGPCVKDEAPAPAQP